MRVLQSLSATLCVTVLLLPLSASAAVSSIHPHHRISAHAMVRHSNASHARRAEHVSYEHPTSSISPERATEIQTALIKQGYLSGEPTGTWDATSIAAMQKLQADNNWQTKLVPDSRALIKLGLGPGSIPAVTAVAPPMDTLAGLTTPAAN